MSFCIGSERMNPYFAYGSNMLRAQMRDRCPDHRFIGCGVLKGYRWIISARGYANIIRSPLDAVHGVVYEISGPDERKLDQYEGVSGGSYQKQRLSVEIDGLPITCLVYVDPTKDEGLPSNEYIDRINRGIADAGLPSKYVENCIRPLCPVKLDMK